MTFQCLFRRQLFVASITTKGGCIVFLKRMIVLLKRMIVLLNRGIILPKRMIILLKRMIVLLNRGDRMIVLLNRHKYRSSTTARRISSPNRMTRYTARFVATQIGQSSCFVVTTLAIMHGFSCYD